MRSLRQFMDYIRFMDCQRFKNHLPIIAMLKEPAIASQSGHRVPECFLYLGTWAECDILVSKLLGFETFPFFLMVSVSVSETFGIEKSIGIGFGKIWYRKKYRYRFRKISVSKKVSVSVSEKNGIEKSIGFGIEKNWYRKKVSDSVSLRFWVSSHTAIRCTLSAFQMS